MLEVKNIELCHGKLQVLWDISLNVNTGERVGLLGANGAGKSSTMGAVMGLYPLQSGSITFSGQSINQLEVNQLIKLGIALVPEGRKLFTQMTVEENLKMGAYIKEKRTSINEGLDSIYQLFPILKEKRLQMAGQLSGGQQQMVTIGRALMSKPKMLLLDEPFIGVAPRLVDEIMQALREINELGVGMVLVEQNVHRALDFVTRAYVIENGRNVLEGNANLILSDEHFQEKFLGIH